MKRTWLTALIPIAMALASLHVTTATEHVCIGQPVLASDADDRLRGQFAGGASDSGCDSSVSSKQVSHIAFDQASFHGAVHSFSFAPEPSILALLGLASLAFPTPPTSQRGKAVDSPQTPVVKKLE
jgi:hypothetical protein